MAGISFAFMTVMVSGASMFAMAKILHLLLGWNMDVSIWVASLTVAVYVTLGGLVSAVFNEVLQFFLIWFGSLLIPILGLIHAGGWTKMMATIQQQRQVIHPDVPGQPTSPACGTTSARSTQPHGHRLVRHGFRPGAGRELRLLVHRLPPGAAGDRGQEPPRRPERHHHRRRAEDAACR